MTAARRAMSLMAVGDLAVRRYDKQWVQAALNQPCSLIEGTAKDERCCTGQHSCTAQEESVFCCTEAGSTGEGAATSRLQEPALSSKQQTAAARSSILHLSRQCHRPNVGPGGSASSSPRKPAAASGSKVHNSAPQAPDSAPQPPNAAPQAPDSAPQPQNVGPGGSASSSPQQPAAASGSKVPDSAPQAPDSAPQPPNVGPGGSASSSPRQPAAARCTIRRLRPPIRHLSRRMLRLRRLILHLSRRMWDLVVQHPAARSSIQQPAAARCPIRHLRRPIRHLSRRMLRLSRLILHLSRRMWDLVVQHPAARGSQRQPAAARCTIRSLRPPIRHLSRRMLRSRRLILHLSRRMWDLVVQHPAASGSQRQQGAQFGASGARFATSAAECGTWWFSIQQPAAASGSKVHNSAPQAPDSAPQPPNVGPGGSASSSPRQPAAARCTIRRLRRLILHLSRRMWDLVVQHPAARGSQRQPAAARCPIRRLSRPIRHLSRRMLRLRRLILHLSRRMWDLVVQHPAARGSQRQPAAARCPIRRLRCPIRHLRRPIRHLSRRMLRLRRLILHLSRRMWDLVVQHPAARSSIQQPAAARCPIRHLRRPIRHLSRRMLRLSRLILHLSRRMWDLVVQHPAARGSQRQPAAARCTIRSLRPPIRHLSRRMLRSRRLILHLSRRMWDLVVQHPAASGSQRQQGAQFGASGARFATSAAECGTWWFSIQQPAAASGSKVHNSAPQAPDSAPQPPNVGPCGSASSSPRQPAAARCTIRRLRRLILHLSRRMWDLVVQHPAARGSQRQPAAARCPIRRLSRPIRHLSRRMLRLRRLILHLSRRMWDLVVQHPAARSSPRQPAAARCPIRHVRRPIRHLSRRMLRLRCLILHLSRRMWDLVVQHPAARSSPRQPAAARCTIQRLSRPIRHLSRRMLRLRRLILHLSRRMWDLVVQHPAASSSQRQPAAARCPIRHLRRRMLRLRCLILHLSRRMWDLVVQHPAARGSQRQQGAPFGASGAECCASGA